jgi:hypothetical protein
LPVGHCTIISDETGAVNKNDDLMSLLKNGYDSRGKTSKLFTRDPEYSFFFKMIIAERMPEVSYIEVFVLQRIRDKDTLEPQGNPARQARPDNVNLPSDTIQRSNS